MTRLKEDGKSWLSLLEDWKARIEGADSERTWSQVSWYEDSLSEHVSRFCAVVQSRGLSYCMNRDSWDLGKGGGFPGHIIHHADGEEVVDAGKQAGGEAQGWPIWANGLLGRALIGYYAGSQDKQVLRALEMAYGGSRIWAKRGFAPTNFWPAFETYTWTGNKEIDKDPDGFLRCQQDQEDQARRERSAVRIVVQPHARREPPVVSAARSRRALQREHDSLGDRAICGPATARTSTRPAGGTRSSNAATTACSRTACRSATRTPAPPAPCGEPRPATWPATCGVRSRCCESAGKGGWPTAWSGRSSTRRRQLSSAISRRTSIIRPPTASPRTCPTAGRTIIAACTGRCAAPLAEPLPAQLRGAHVDGDLRQRPGRHALWPLQGLGAGGRSRAGGAGVQDRLSFQRFHRDRRQAGRGSDLSAVVPHSRLVCRSRDHA